MDAFELVTPDEPLGPPRHESVFANTQAKDSNVLVYKVETFDRIFNNRLPIIIGRKGSGKTSVISGYRSLSENGRYYFKPAIKSRQDDDIYVIVGSWDHFHELVRRVCDAAARLAGRDTNWEAISPEHLTDLWMNEIYYIVFQEIYTRARRDTHVRSQTKKIQKLIEGEDIYSMDSHGSLSVFDEAFKSAKEELRTYITTNKRRCFVLLDSMEEYPIRSHRVQRVLSGFLRAINEFHTMRTGLTVICCIPEEIEKYVKQASSNQLKDLSRVGRLKWKPAALLKIVAERYRFFLSLYFEQGMNELLPNLASLDFDKKADLQAFYSAVMPKVFTNYKKTKEDPLAFIMRHTQLLPRQLILLFNKAIVHTKATTNEWAPITEDAILLSLEETQENTVEDLIALYDFICPDSLHAFRKVIPTLSHVFMMSDLDKIAHLLSKECAHEIEAPLEMLYEMGMLGFVDEEQQDNERYIYAYFRYNSNRPITFAQNRKYCIHPLFSRTWSLTNGEIASGKMVYPAGLADLYA